MPVCGNCGQVAPTLAKFCASCGAILGRLSATDLEWLFPMIADLIYPIDFVLASLQESDSALLDGKQVKNRAGQMFRLAAYALHNSQTPLGAYLRRMKAKLGPAAATTATAHKLAVIFYTLVKNQVEYDETVWTRLDVLRQARLAARLKRQAQQLGYKLIPIESNAAA
jgi:hypothetical protein